MRWKFQTWLSSYILVAGINFAAIIVRIDLLDIQIDFK
jgi:hypothetical protein